MVPLLVKKWLVKLGAARHLPLAKRLAGADGVGFLHYYSDRTLAAPLDALADPAAFPDAPAEDGIHLNLAAPRFDSPLSVGRLTADRLGNPPPWGLPALRKAVAAKAGRRLHPRDEVLVTHGASGAYAATLDALVNPGDKVVLFDPCSPLFSIGAASRRARVCRVPTAAKEGLLTCDLDALSLALRGAKLLVVADPDNPTGAALAPEVIDRVAWAANRCDVLIYADESWSRFRYSPAPGIARRPELEHRTLVAGSLTHGYGLAAARVGWLVGPRNLLKATALAATLAAPYVSGIGQHLALRELEADDELFGPTLAEFAAKRRYTVDRLAAMGLPCDPPAGGHFAWVDVSSTGRSGRAFAEGLQRAEGVLVGPGDVFGPGSKGFVRVSFAEEDGRLREGLARMARFVAAAKPELAPRPTAAIRPSVEAGAVAAFSRA